MQKHRLPTTPSVTDRGPEYGGGWPALEVHIRGLLRGAPHQARGGRGRGRLRPQEP